MVDTVDDTMVTGEPFKAGSAWFRCVVEKPGEIRLTWGPTDDWATWDSLDFAIIPEATVAETVVALAATFSKGD
jgi:hypothetical protein